MRDLLALPTGQVWKAVETDEDAALVAKLSGMEGVRQWFDIDVRRRAKVVYYGLFSRDGSRVDVAVRGPGIWHLSAREDGTIVFGHNFADPFVEHSAAIDALGVEIGHSLEGHRDRWKIRGSSEDATGPSP